jgi:hypothetical protein
MLEAGRTGYDFATLLGPYLVRVPVAPVHLVIHDAYICSLRVNSDADRATAHLEPEAVASALNEATAASKNMYFMGGSAGIVFDITDMIIHEHEEVQCPF